MNDTHRVGLYIMPATERTLRIEHGPRVSLNFPAINEFARRFGAIHTTSLAMPAEGELFRGSVRRVDVVVLVAPVAPPQVLDWQARGIEVVVLTPIPAAWPASPGITHHSLADLDLVKGLAKAVAAA